MKMGIHARVTVVPDVGADWTELTICIFAEGILRLMAEVKQVVAVHRKACPDIHGRAGLYFF